MYLHLVKGLKEVGGETTPLAELGDETTLAVKHESE